MKTMTSTSPALTVHRLSSIRLDDWEASTAALRDAPACELRQSWLTKPSRHFLPAWVRTGWTNDALIVHAEMRDRDIFNPESRFNERAFLRGDVFEIFLRPLEQETYFEIHVTPHNQKLQLRIPSTRALRCSSVEQFKIHDPVIPTRTQVRRKNERWFVLALIPFELVLEKETMAAGARWLFSFSRYDYTRGQARPVFSSTSLHLKCDFHRQHEWGLLRFEK